ncbi:MAG TPA: hypothetical protein VK465_10355, partial [Fibrobacteria bacterium]|nr:hypothetical protein [Fibrobacteria bacterium]
QERRLTEAISRYADKFQGALHPLVLERLDGLRKLSDSARVGLTDAQREALTSSVEFALKTALVVPVVGEFSGLVALCLEAGDLLQGISRSVYQMYCPDAAAAGRRLELLDKEYAVNVRALIDKGLAGHEKDPVAQFRLRALALMGFLRLLNRCGSRVAISDDFERKVREYRLEEYLSTFLLNPKPVWFPVYAGVFIDDLWVHAHPGKHPEWTETWAMDVGGAEKGTRNSLGNYTQPWSGAAYAGVPGGSYTLDFHKYFPIHTQDTKGVLELAKTFCTNFEGTITQEPAGGSIMAREDGDSRWIPVKDCPFPITPLTEIRVMVVFRGYKDLTGVPLSFQLIRTDVPFEIHGPVYETLVIPAVMSLDGRGEDQGLIEEEKHYADGGYYCAVIHPHYTFRGVLYKGVKPQGLISVTSHAKIEVAFNFFTGTGGKKGRIKTGRSSTEFTVHLPLNLYPMLQMICERPFLYSRSDKLAFRKLFYDFSLPRYVGVILKKTGDKKDNTYVYYPGSVEELKKTAFYFSWKDEFEMLLLFHSRAHAEGWEQQKTIQFPAFIQTQEFTGINTVGPEYSAEVCSLRTHQLQRPGTVTVESLQAELHELGLIGGKAVLPSGLVEFQEPGYLWACLAKFAYSVEEEPDEMQSKLGFKPFSGTWKKEEEEYTYGFGISTPDPLGLNISDFLEIKVPGLPKDFLSNTVIEKSGLAKKLVTEKRVHGSLEIRKVDL